MKFRAAVELTITYHRVRFFCLTTALDGDLGRRVVASTSDSPNCFFLAMRADDLEDQLGIAIVDAEERQA